MQNHLVKLIKFHDDLNVYRVWSLPWWCPCWFPFFTQQEAICISAEEVADYFRSLDHD